jgi:hypothetical protein
MATVRVDIDQHTAAVLEAPAAELGVTVPELIAELAALDGSAREASADEIAELDARTARAAGDTLVSHDHVVQLAAHLGHPRVPTVAGPVDIQWSADALDDVQQFADFLHDHYPGLAGRVAMWSSSYESFTVANCGN